MSTQPGDATVNPPVLPRDRAAPWVVLRWPGSALFTLVLSVGLGLGYALVIMTLPRLNPANLSWFRFDPAQYYIGWALFSQDGAWHWPLTFTDRVGFPIGEAIALLDPNSLLALLLKPLAPLLPTPFQYLGLSVALACALQFYFGSLLMRILVGPRLWPALAGGLLFMVAPVMTTRLRGHYATANHWLILAALCLYFAWQRRLITPGLSLALLCGLLAASAMATNVYVALGVVAVLLAACVRAIWVSRAEWPWITATAGAILCAALVSAWAIGLMQAGSGFAADGYRDYSMNLLAPIDSSRPGSILLPGFSRATPLQYEGYNYLGLGTLALLGISACALLGRWWKPQWRARDVAPLLGLGVICTLLALSTKVTAGSHVLIDLDPHERLTPYLAALRCSGRLFWVPYYLITLGALVAPFRAFTAVTGTLIVVAALALQWADGAPLRHAVHTALARAPVDNRLQSPIWQRLGEQHQNLIVLPAWQCEDGDTPGGQDGYRLFGMLAASQHMRINSYYPARSSPASLAYHCGKSVGELAARPLRKDSAYVLSPPLAAVVTATGAQTNACHDVDGFILCSVVSDFGLQPSASLPPLALSENPVRFAANPAAAKYLVSGWHDITADGVWSKGTAVVTFQVTPQQQQDFRIVVLHLNVPPAPMPVRVSARLGNAVASMEVPAGNGPRSVDLRLALHQSPGGMQTILLRTEPPLQTPRTPTLGAGLVSLDLLP